MVNFSEYQQEFKPSEQDLRTHKLAQEYHSKCENYDRCVCTGPIINGSIIPVGSHEIRLVNKNAIKVLQQIIAKAYNLGISKEDIIHAIVKQG